MLFKTLTGCCLLFISVAINAQDIECTVLDDFQNTTNLGLPAIITMGDPGPLNIIDDGSPGVLGSIRNVVLGPLVGDVSTLVISADTFSLSNAANSVAPVSVLYDANGAGLNTGLTTTSIITYTLVNVDLPGVSASVEISDSANNTADLTIMDLPNIIDGDTFPLPLDFPLDQFNGIGGVSLSDIQSIELTIAPSQSSTDLAITDAEICRPPIPVPEVPALSSWGLIALAAVLSLVGFMVFRRKREIAS